MTKNANEKSINAKAYINGKMDDLRQLLKGVDKAVEQVKGIDGADKMLKKALLENFRVETASPEYQENLKIVHDDTRIIRDYAKRKKGGTITAKEFRDAKTEFYGKDMELGMDEEEFQRLTAGEQVRYLINKFGNGDKAFGKVLDLMESGQYVCNNVCNGSIDFQRFKNVSISSAKRALESVYGQLFFMYPGIFKDSVYNDDEIIQLIGKNRYNIFLQWVRAISDKMTSDNQKKLVGALIDGGHLYKLLPYFHAFNLGEGVDSFEYIISKIVDNCNDKVLSHVIKNHYEYLGKNFDDYEHEKKTCDAFIKAGKIGILRENMDSLKHLSDIEKAQIMEDTEEEKKLKAEKFEKDLESLKQLGQELGFEIQVNEIKESED